MGCPSMLFHSQWWDTKIIQKLKSGQLAHFSPSRKHNCRGQENRTHLKPSSTGLSSLCWGDKIWPIHFSLPPPSPPKSVCCTYVSFSLWLRASLLWVADYDIWSLPWTRKNSPFNKFWLCGYHLFYFSTVSIYSSIPWVDGPGLNLKSDKGEVPDSSASENSACGTDPGGAKQLQGSEGSLISTAHQTFHNWWSQPAKDDLEKKP